MMKPEILFFLEAGLQRRKLIEEHFVVYDTTDFPDRASAIQNTYQRVRGIVTSNFAGLSVDEIKAFPNLEIVSAVSVGYERLAIKEAQARGIVCTSVPGVTAFSVADHAMGLLLAITRNIPANDFDMRKGGFNQSLRPTITGKKIGIYGLGFIGEEIAKRAAGGFSMDVGYHNRNAIAGSPYRYFSSLPEMAEWCDFLVLAVPGTGQTKHSVTAGILDALGRKGFLINVGRGEVVATDVLIAALREKRIMGAALDVFESEPKVPPDLFDVSNIVLSPHVAGFSPEAFSAVSAAVRDNLVAHFSGKPVPMPIPPMP